MNIEEILKKAVKENIEVKIDKLIEDEINDFTKQLLRRKDDYIAEIMKSIRIVEEKEPLTMSNHYIITFENKVFLESKEKGE